jgi:cytochrome bd-type quinol oxidase subunit 2
MSSFIRLLFSFLVVAVCLVFAGASMGYSEQMYPNITMGTVCYTINNTSAFIGGTGSTMITIAVSVLIILAGIALAYVIYGYVSE